jgi:hypothetical protein
MGLRRSTGSARSTSWAVQRALRHPPRARHPPMQPTIAPERTDHPTRGLPMQNVRWFLRTIAGLDRTRPPTPYGCDCRGTVRHPGQGAAPTTAPANSRWGSCQLTDLTMIERAVFLELRAHLTKLLASLPGPCRAPHLDHDGVAWCAAGQGPKLLELLDRVCAWGGSHRVGAGQNAQARSGWVTRTTETYFCGASGNLQTGELNRGKGLTYDRMRRPSEKGSLLNTEA